jgi:Mg-chelatase subunit ChlD
MDLTEIVAIVDRSGSMMEMKMAAIEGFNNFLKEQQELPGDANFTHVQFDTEYEVVFHGGRVQDAKPYTMATFHPRGGTALYDAVGKTVVDVAYRLEHTAESDRAKKVIVCILTDGEENSSRMYSRQQVMTLVEENKAKGWEFVFVGAGLSKFTAQGAAAAMGIDSSNVVHTSRSSSGMNASYNALNDATRLYRSSGNLKNWRILTTTENKVIYF